MAELIDKGAVKELPVYEFGVSLLSAEKYVKLSDFEKLPATTEAEIKAKAIDEFFDELQKYEDDDWLKLKMSSIYEIAEQLKEE